MTSRSSIAPSVWAIACFFTSALAVAAAPSYGKTPAERSLEMELEIARTPKLYLLLDPSAGRLDVKIRGLVLESVAVTDAVLLVNRRNDDAGVEPGLPAHWTVSSIPDYSRRRVAEVGKLQPYREQQTADGSPADPPPQAPEAAEPAARYRVPLEGDWELLVGPSVRRSRLFNTPRLLADRLRAVFRGEEFRPADALALAVSAEDARRLHHLFRPDVEILAVSESP